MALIGDNYEVYRPRLNQVIVGKVQKAQGRQGVGNALAFMNMSRAQLEANYDTAFIGVEQIQGGTQTWHVQLTPKNGSSYKVADLWVDSNGMPRQAKVTEMNNDTTTVLLSNIRENETVQGSIFKLKYPSNAKKIRA
jgi:outer membrane lipoprotein-sorting protein